MLAALVLTLPPARGQESPARPAPLPAPLPVPRPDLERAPPAPPDPAPVHEAEEPEVRDEGEEVLPEQEAIPEDAEEAAREALEEAAALRRPSFDREEILACEARLSLMEAEFEIVEPVGADDPHCGVERGLILSSVAGIRLEPAVTLRCAAAYAAAEWMTQVVAPMARLYLDERPSAIATAGDYECRWRRGGSDDAAFSQHAFANALDVTGVTFSDREPVRIAPPEENEPEARLFQAAIRGGACAYFTTVLGPMTNADHADHLHLDMADRRGGFRLCE